VLLAGVTALIVARPFVLGEDPGLLDRRLSDSAGMVLSLLWLVLAVGWAIWRIWSKQGTWYASLVDVPLAVVVGLVFASSAWAATYKHPAWLIAWEWLILLVLFALVRQLARTPGERRSLLAAAVATAVSLSSQTIYEYAIVKPQDRQKAASPAKLRQEVAKLGIYLQEDDPQLEHWRNRFVADNVSATFANSNSLAGYLALLLPAAVGWTLVCRRRQGRTGWWTVALAVCALLLGVQLWLTLSRGALLGTLLVGTLVAVVRGRQLLWAHKKWVVAGTAGLAAMVFLFLHSSQGKAGDVKAPAPEAMERRFEYWTATWRMIRAPGHARNCWLGVGPGNFGEQYRRYMAPTAEETVKEPHNFALEMWATCGLFALAALVAAWFLFFWRTRYAWTEPDPGPEAEEPLGPPRWEFYLGGMAGLTLGFVLQVSGLPQDNISDRILLAGLVSGVGSLLWFAAFALLDNLPWEGPSQVLAMVAGVAALLINLCVSGGISFPSVAQPLWTVAALALAGRATPWRSRHWLGIVLPLPLLAVLGFIYFSAVLYPVANCGRALADARKGEGYWQEKGEREWLKKLHEAALPQNKLQVTREATTLVEDHIVRPLERAAQADEDDAYPRLQLGYWRGVQWQMLSQLREFSETPQHNEAERIKVRQQQRELSKAALKDVEKAYQLDPDGLEGYRMNYQLYSMFTDAPDLRESSEGLRLRRQQAGGAAAAARLLLQRDPTEAEWHYRLADALFQAGDIDAAKAEVAETRKLRENDAIRQRNPATEARLHYRLADELFKVGDTDEALFQVRLGRRSPPREPPDPQLHYRLAEALSRAGDTADSRLHALEAFQMEAAVSDRAEKLTDTQRENVKKWLGRAPTN
jgi:tetratricopeptide (TPR) repeat protein